MSCRAEASSPGIERLPRGAQAHTGRPLGDRPTPLCDVSVASDAALKGSLRRPPAALDRCLFPAYETAHTGTMGIPEVPEGPNVIGWVPRARLMRRYATDIGPPLPCRSCRLPAGNLMVGCKSRLGRSFSHEAAHLGGERLSQLVAYDDEYPVDVKGKVEIHQSPMSSATGSRSVEGVIQKSLVYARGLARPDRCWFLRGIRRVVAP